MGAQFVRNPRFRESCTLLIERTAFVPSKGMVLTFGKHGAVTLTRSPADTHLAQHWQTMTSLLVRVGMSLALSYGRASRVTMTTKS